MILVVQTALFSIFLIILFKRLQKIINDNNDLRKNIYDRVDEITLSIKDFSTFILKSDMFSANTSLQKSLSDIHLLLKKDDSAPWKFNNEKIKIGNSNKHNGDYESMSDFKSPAAPDPASTSATFTSVHLEPKIDKSIDLKNELEKVENRTDFSNDQNFENNSVDELKTLENEILIALKRLEKTNSYVDEQKEKQGNE